MIPGAQAAAAGGVLVTDYRILVTGSRTWDDILAVTGALTDEVLRARGLGMRPVVVHGACPRGADMIAARWARAYQVAEEPHPADWDRHGKAAGFRRNEEMCRLGAVVCLAFIRDGSSGTSDCAGRARALGIPVREVPYGAARGDGYLAPEAAS